MEATRIVGSSKWLANVVPWRNDQHCLRLLARVREGSHNLASGVSSVGIEHALDRGRTETQYRLRKLVVRLPRRHVLHGNGAIAKGVQIKQRLRPDAGVFAQRATIS